MTNVWSGRREYVSAMVRPLSGAGARVRPATPTLRFERRLLRGGAARVGGMDEVGRGAPAGPVHVGMVVLDVTTGRPPDGVRDSKQLSTSARQQLVPAIEAWAAEFAVGTASSGEVDSLGVNGALRLAGLRALHQIEMPVDVLVLDGIHDWLSPGLPTEAESDARARGLVVVTRAKADRNCTSVAAASILAKVARDAVMVGLAPGYPDYGWEANKGYGTEAHFTAIRGHGLTPHHRRSWRLPTPD